MSGLEAAAGVLVVICGFGLALTAWRTRTVLAFLLGVGASLTVPVANLVTATHRVRAVALVAGVLAVALGAVLHVIGQRLERLLADEPEDVVDVQANAERRLPPPRRM